MREEGVVVGIKDGRLIVNIRRHPACGSCKACSMAEDKIMKIEFENTINAQKGDRVNLELDDFVILKGAILFYGAPLLGLILGIFIGGIFAKKIDLAMPDEVVSALFGIMIMLITFIAVRKYNLVNKKMYKPKITKA